jgi:hypothetical protein
MQGHKFYQNPPSMMMLRVMSHSFSSNMVLAHDRDPVGLRWNFFFFPLSFSLMLLKFMSSLPTNNCVLQFIILTILVVILLIIIYFDVFWSLTFFSFVHEHFILFDFYIIFCPFYFWLLFFFFYVLYFSWLFFSSISFLTILLRLFL